MKSDKTYRMYDRIISYSMNYVLQQCRNNNNLDTIIIGKYNSKNYDDIFLYNIVEMIKVCVLYDVKIKVKTNIFTYLRLKYNKRNRNVKPYLQIKKPTNYINIEDIKKNLELKSSLIEEICKEYNYN